MLERTRLRRFGLWAGGVGAALTVGALAVTGLSAASPPAAKPYLRAFPEFAPDVTPQMPGDIDNELKGQLDQAKKFSQVQREFDLYSWQMFFALNWPTNNQGEAAPSLTDTAFGAPHWTLWHSSASIYQVDGAKPRACSADGKLRAMALTRDLSEPVSKGLKAFSVQATANADPRRKRFLGVISAVGELNASNVGLSEIGQAFTGPLVDQNGEFVYYEIMVDPNETGYLCDQKLYNINGQVAFAGAGKTVDMPLGDERQDWSGSFELKFAWKILKPGVDDPSRFYTTAATIIDVDAKGKQVERNVTVGLVGMHIGHKSVSSPQWVWSTFEQVDNLDVDPVAHPNLHPSFTDPNCPLCTVNQQPQAVNGVYPKTPIQAWRAIPIPGDKVALNAEVRAAMARQGSIWQYYQLIDTQWPISPKTPPSKWDAGLPQAVANKPGGQPTPVFLTNITMETYFQWGAQEACNSEEAVPKAAKCVGPPSVPSATARPAVWTTPMNNGPGGMKPGVHTNIFATESCMGCHSSAGIWTSYDPATGKGDQSGQLTGDFSWLMSQKAAWNKGS
ncbi:MAG: hypothetical protein WA840_14230 [Caulobacteraceae bacterium]